MNSPSVVEFTTKLPSLKSSGKQLLVFDKKILSHHKPLAAWCKKFDFIYPVTGGESLKDIKNFPLHVSRIQKLCKQQLGRDGQIIALGGGSVGDFAGFVASIWKRGVDYINIPSTWLGAIDSAHGGKNALNVEGVKNQVGTFYFPSKVYVAFDILSTTPLKLKNQAYSEIVKMGILNGGDLWKSLSRHPEGIRQHVRLSVEGKYKWVKKDPHEKTGSRAHLNLGHTMGHALESFYKLSHGDSIGQGLYFSTRWSQSLGHLSQKEADRIYQILAQYGISDRRSKSRFKAFPKAKLLGLLREDKKSSQKGLQFIFINKVGKTTSAIVKPEAIVKEAVSQGWAR